MNYSRLTIEEREKIHLQINEGKSNRDIARSLGRCHSTIYREVHRFSTRFEYSPSKANQLASKATKNKGRKPFIASRPELLERVIQKILKDYSQKAH